MSFELLAVCAPVYNAFIYAARVQLGASNQFILLYLISEQRYNFLPSFSFSLLSFFPFFFCRYDRRRRDGLGWISSRSYSACYIRRGRRRGMCSIRPPIYNVSPAGVNSFYYYIWYGFKLPTIIPNRELKSKRLAGWLAIRALPFSSRTVYPPGSVLCQAYDNGNNSELLMKSVFFFFSRCLL